MNSGRIKVLWHWLSMGPYHFARMAAVAGRPEIDLTVVETTSRGDHDWKRNGAAAAFPHVTLSRERRSKQVLAETRGALEEALARHAPDVVVAAGYSEEHSRRAALQYAQTHPGARCLLWSESTAVDQRRFWLAERLKSLVVCRFDGALVAGSRHAEYLERLSMPAERICIVGGCVDNKRFFRKAEEAPQVADWNFGRTVAAPYFLYVGRFVRQKNLHTLLQAFHRYRRKWPGRAWDLVLVGSGPEESRLRGAIRDQGIQGVHFAGFRQADELPAFYANAGCFVLPSAEEPWGLVTNEAMASSLPVIVSRRCGCAPELVQEGHNGFTFDPNDIKGLARVLETVWQMPLCERERLGAESRRIIEGFSPELFAERSAAHIKKLWLAPAKSPFRATHRTLRSRLVSSFDSIPLSRMPR